MKIQAKESLLRDGTKCAPGHCLPVQLTYSIRHAINYVRIAPVFFLLGCCGSIQYKDTFGSSFTYVL